jgi:hypothetical protein
MALTIAIISPIGRYLCVICVFVGRIHVLRLYAFQVSKFDRSGLLDLGSSPIHSYVLKQSRDALGWCLKFKTVWTMALINLIKLEWLAIMNI